MLLRNDQIKRNEKKEKNFGFFMNYACVIHWIDQIRKMIITWIEYCLIDINIFRSLSKIYMNFKLWFEHRTEIIGIYFHPSFTKLQLLLEFFRKLFLKLFSNTDGRWNKTSDTNEFWNKNPNICSLVEKILRNDGIKIERKKETRYQNCSQPTLTPIEIVQTSENEMSKLFWVNIVFIILKCISICLVDLGSIDFQSQSFHREKRAKWGRESEKKEDSQ